MRQEGKRHRSVVVCVLFVTGIACLAMLMRTMVSPPVADPSGQEENNRSSHSQDASGLGSAERNGGARLSRQSNRRRYITRQFPLTSAEHVESLLLTLPDLSTSNVGTLHLEPVKLRHVPVELLKQIAVHGQHLQVLFLRRCTSDENLPAISEMGMKHISQLANLEGLDLGCRFSEVGFRHLSNLTNLKTLSLNYGPRSADTNEAISAYEFFETVSKMPNIRRVSVLGADYSQPIDDATYKAIASLNGRLESLSFGEWSETTIHRSMFPAIAEIESLTWLEMGDSVATYKDLAPIRKSLVYLDRIVPNARKFMGIHTTENCGWKPATPIYMSSVDSHAAVFRLLREVVGGVQAKDVRREVIRRRIGVLSRREVASESRMSLSEILESSFGLVPNPDMRTTLNAVSRENPELDEQMRRYLSGMDLPRRRRQDSRALVDLKGGA